MILASRKADDKHRCHLESRKAGGSKLSEVLFLHRTLYTETGRHSRVGLLCRRTQDNKALLVDIFFLDS